VSARNDVAQEIVQEFSFVKIEFATIVGYAVGGACCLTS
jgi:hypothetical protein